MTGLLGITMKPLMEFGRGREGEGTNPQSQHQQPAGRLADTQPRHVSRQSTHAILLESITEKLMQADFSQDHKKVREAYRIVVPNRN